MCTSRRPSRQRIAGLEPGGGRPWPRRRLRRWANRWVTGRLPIPRRMGLGPAAQPVARRGPAPAAGRGWPGRRSGDDDQLARSGARRRRSERGRRGAPRLGPHPRRARPRRPRGPRRARARAASSTASWSTARTTRRNAPRTRPTVRMTDALPPQYNPAAIEAALYRWWQRSGPVRARTRHGSTARRYVIMMPPPNVTAVLHMGHGLNNTVQDVLVRFERMRGRDRRSGFRAPTTPASPPRTWWSGSSRRKARPASTWGARRSWSGSGPTCGRPATPSSQQLRALGASCDWSRTYFTLDPDLSRAVREVFVRLHEKGLIYRGKYIINWCPRCLTALSNEEAEKEEVDGKIWHLRYPLEDGSGIHHRRDHPARDHARRHRRRGAPQGQALHEAGRQAGPAAAGGPARSRSSPTTRSTPSSAPAP